MTDDIRQRIEGSMRGTAHRDESMALHTSLKVGGTADLFVVPADMADLETLLAILAETGTPYLVVGGGYNLLVRDGGIRGVVISLERFQRLELLPGNRLSAEAGVRNHELVRFAADNGLAGLEFLCGIPGTVGGALTMNAGAHGSETFDRVISLTTLRGGELKHTPRAELECGYRFLRLEPGEVVVAAEFELGNDNPAAIIERVRAHLMQRGAIQKVGFPNAGSFFRNPPGLQAWKLIDEAGFRGFAVGGAQVSEVHSNFLVNKGGATAQDFLSLASAIKEKVLALTGTVLEEEVRILGEG